LLDEEESKKFDEYMKNPKCTKRGILLIMESFKRAQRFKFE
jgi:hypothetical protein